MANLNKVMLIGRLTRDPEPIQLGGNTAGAKFGFAVNNRKLNQANNTWEEVPVFIDMEIWNRGESKQADRVLNTLRKGQQVFIEGHLKYDQWDDKNSPGTKRSALRVVVEQFQYLEPRQDGEGGGGGMRSAPARQPARAAVGAGGRGGSYGGGDDYGEDAPPPSSNRGGKSSPPSDDDIPF